MAKWMIPRHKPIKDREEWKADRNHGKRFALKGKHNDERKAKRQKERRAYLELFARMGDQESAREIGQCTRKSRLNANKAWLCVKTAFLETGKAAYAYKCEFCGDYHLTTHPFAGKVYPIRCESMEDVKRRISVG